MSNSANKVLIVDDDFISLEVLKAMVGQYSVEILTAQSGQEAIDIAMAEKPRLILLDHELPDIDGIDVYCQLADQLGDQIPLVAMVTGHQGDDFAQRCEAAGINKRLHKPVQPIELAELLRIASSVE
ncbi:response regulator [Pseudidiomarina donghaiensis]|uniref:Response regulator n=1 Tax=Pseudidiomarina donghaiensis TaxID=519452 RepID=A0A432XEG7_9GAMM|nr:response regulator [Pseudidiomarina donghaiensis]RUO47105.1 response regulator [Pseudidiomarina donghaiensis]SFV23611.1 Response regulator receiver domain-containing protein [Pseudidiomarina donghaiensis]